MNNSNLSGKLPAQDVNHDSLAGDSLPAIHLEQLPPRLKEGFARAGWTDLMPVQAKTIPYILAGRDMMIQSRTGSGKTGAYLLPVFDRIDPARPSCQVLVLAPTRELASQVLADAEMISSGTDIRCVAVYGGVGYKAQLEAFRRGAHLVVGTPGRVLDHLLRRSLNLDDLQILVFDEADRMLSMGFYPDMQRLQSYLPERRINTYMFSATFPPNVIRLAQVFLVQPGFINLSSDHIHVTETLHEFVVVPGMDKDRSLVRLIEIENPESALIFCNTKARVHYVNVVLQRFGYNSDELSSDLSQGEREKVMRRIRKADLRFLVATDVAARGIDLPELSHVFIYEPPEEAELYIHRAGRTGRAGAGGVAISLVNPLERSDLMRIARQYSIDLQELPPPSDEDVAKVVAERVTVLLEARLRARDRLKVERMQRLLPLARQLGEEESELSLIAMLLDDFYQETFHRPPAGPALIESDAQEKKAKRRGYGAGRRKRSSHSDAKKRS